MDGRDGKGQEDQEESLIWNLQYCSQVKSSSNFKGGRARLLWGARRRERSGGRGAAQPAWLDSPEPASLGFILIKSQAIVWPQE